MIDYERLWRTLTRFTSVLSRAEDLESALAELGEEITAILGVAAAGLMLEDADGHLRFLGASDPALDALERLQIELSEGPCLLAYQSGEDVISTDLGADERFPRFGPRGVEAGLAAVYSFPVRVDDVVVGALNLYDRDARKLDDEQIEAAHALSGIAASYVAHLAELDAQRELSEQLSHALHNRVVIEQAKGYVAAQLSIPVEEARELLRGYARHHRVRLRDVADDIVRGRLDAGTLT
ncbi:MAG: GAF and ANTAR domain-containing protein [Actinobacteria bacterium]|nr:GAF and ANTAR domain-containing protein [Actinomycetota bacterium]